MPFTPAHAAAVWPLLGRRGLCGLALLVGAMAPDFEYFLRFELLSTISHTWRGLLVFDLPIALVVTVAVVACRRPLLRALPPALAARLAPLLALPSGSPGRALLVLVASAAIGAATHLLWDGLTHGGGMFVSRAPALREAVSLPLLGELPLYRALQHASTTLGLLVVAVGVARLPRAPAPPPSDPRALAASFSSASPAPSSSRGSPGRRSSGPGSSGRSTAPSSAPSPRSRSCRPRAPREAPPERRPPRRRGADLLWALD
ncbi:MAG: DUF4184 family protein [Myxococcales bacterium]|nr:DUF4184 family protein [Myxococcales bacterium]